MVRFMGRASRIVDFRGAVSERSMVVWAAVHLGSAVSKATGSGGADVGRPRIISVTACLFGSVVQCRCLFRHLAGSS